MIYAKSPCPILSNLRRPIRKIGADISSVMDRICSCHERGGRRAGMGRGWGGEGLSGSLQNGQNSKMEPGKV